MKTCRALKNIFLSFGFLCGEFAFSEVGLINMREPSDPLQRYEIDEVKISSKTMEIKESIGVVAIGPDYYRYVVRKGDYIGKNFGMIVDLQNNYMLIEEVHDCGKDRWQLRWISYLGVQEDIESSRFKKFREIAGICE